jgi:two-component system response regulator MprA
MLKVLVIDDDPSMTDILKYLLSSNGMDVKVVNDGQTGIDSLESYNPSIIILDLLMPIIDGWEVCRTIKINHRVPILILSAIDSPSRIAEALDAGADDYLVKPITSDSLIAHINNLLRRTNLKNLHQMAKQSSEINN